MRVSDARGGTLAFHPQALREVRRMLRDRIGACLLLLTLLSGCASSGRLSRTDVERVSHRTYVIVGASSGFGRGTALRLGAMHANVVLAARRAELLEQVANEVRSSGGTPLVVVTDAANQDDVQRLADAAVARFGRIDVWMNVAGVGAIGRFWDIPVEDYSRLIDINVKGVLYGSHIAINQFIKQGGGALVNIGSIDSEVPLAYQATYAASKAAVLSIARSVNQELRQAGYGNTITISTVMPWAADTPWWSHAANYSGHATRMAMMDDPQKVVNAMVWVSLHPREELAVGWKAKASYSMHHVLPDLVERISADTQHAELEKGAPASASSGSLHVPMASGTSVDGGIRERMRQEDNAEKDVESR
jgi:short-subunit dehydrogenase